jgi:hypothetical protein
LYVCGYCGWENLHDSCCTNGCFGSRADGRPLGNLDGVITSAILSALDAGQMSAYHRSRPGRPFRAAGTFSLRSCSFPGGTVAPDVLLGRDPVIDQGSICWMAANRPDALEACSALAQLPRTRLAVALDEPDDSEEHFCSPPPRPRLAPSGGNFARLRRLFGGSRAASLTGPTSPVPVGHFARLRRTFGSVAAACANAVLPGLLSSSEDSDDDDDDGMPPLDPRPIHPWFNADAARPSRKEPPQSSTVGAGVAASLGATQVGPVWFGDYSPRFCPQASPSYDVTAGYFSMLSAGSREPS